MPCRCIPPQSPRRVLRNQSASLHIPLHAHRTTDTVVDDYPACRIARNRAKTTPNGFVRRCSIITIAIAIRISLSHCRQAAKLDARSSPLSQIQDKPLRSLKICVCAVRAKAPTAFCPSAYRRIRSSRRRRTPIRKRNTQCISIRQKRSPQDWRDCNES